MNKLHTTTLLLFSSVLTACVEQTPRMDAEFGNATRATLSAQIINPDAGNNKDPVDGLDGRAARDVIQNYQKSFINPEQSSNAFSIGVGSGNNSGDSGK